MKNRQSSSLQKREIAGLFLGAFFLLLFLSCVSHSPADNSLFSYNSAQTGVQNWCGVLGAHVSALLFYFWGSVAYLFLLALAAGVALLFMKVDLGDQVDRFIGVWGVLVASTLFCRIYSIDLHGGFAGGVLGYYGLLLTQPLVSLTGAKIIACALLLAGLVHASRLSLIATVRVLFFSTLHAAVVAVQVICMCTEKIIRALGSATVHIASFLFASVSLVYGWLRKPAAVSARIVLEPHAHIEQTPVTPPDVAALHEAAATVWQIHTEPRILLALGTYNLTTIRNSVLPVDYRAALARLAVPQKKSEPASAPALGIISSFRLPEISLFINQSGAAQIRDVDQESKIRGQKLEEKLERFGVKGKITAICPGPVITIYEYQPEIDTKISKIMALEDDLALALQALSIRIVAPIPGRSVVGFEISNKTRHDVLLSDVMCAQEFNDSSYILPIILGADSVGAPVVEDLAKAPHLLVAGSTGSGKSVGLNAMLFSLLCKKTPDELKLILVDPKRLEFANYSDIPHLLFPIVTNPRQAAPVLEWTVQEMEERYDTMARAGVRNIFDYHRWFAKRASQSEVDGEKEDEFPNMPFIVVMIDELADLMMVAGKQVEIHIARVAQMARAAGIHMIVATQRPSVDVLTGVIKVNFPSRIGYRVSSKIDSRTILDSGGAEKLLGRGDMLYMNSGSSSLKRVHGAYVSDEQIQRLTDHLREQQEVEYLNLKEVVKAGTSKDKKDLQDELYQQVRELIETKEEISISMLQRQFRIGFNRSARIIEQLELDGLIAPAQGSKPRKVL